MEKCPFTLKKGGHGWCPFCGCAQVPEADVRFLEQIGMDHVASYGRKLGLYLRRRLREIPGVQILTPEDPDMTAGITTFKLDRWPYLELYRFLGQEFKLRCRIVSERGLDAIRVSTHIFNNEEECNRVVEGVRAASSR